MPFVLMRQQMVKNQLMPEGVLNLSLLEVFGQIPREYFIPNEKREIAYLDAALALTSDRFLMRPALLARLFQAAHFKKTDRVLYLGALTGYGPALLSQLVQEIVAVESDPLLFSEMQKNQARLNIGNITPLKGDLRADYAQPGLYDVIFIEGAVSYIPDSVRAQLKPHGFVLTVLNNNKKEGQAVLWAKSEDFLSCQRIFYARTPLLKFFEKK